MSDDLFKDLPQGFTQLLADAAQSDPKAAGVALSAAYQVLRKLAQSRLKSERRDHTLTATALVHEVIPKLFPGLRPPRPDAAASGSTAPVESQRHDADLADADSENDAPGLSHWNDRKHFVATAAMTMRKFLIDYARSRGRKKRLGDRKQMILDTSSVADLASRADPDEIMALDDALNRLKQEHPDPAQVVLLKFYAGLTNEQTAGALGISPETVKRRWKFARAWLTNILTSEE